MSVIVEVQIPAERFELGRILDLKSDATIVLETMVPLGETAVPFFSVHNRNRSGFEERVRNHESVEDLREVSSSDDTTLYAIKWDAFRDPLFEGLRTAEAQLLNATGTATDWQFEFRFPSHTALANFQEYCSDADIPLDVSRIYNPTKPDSGPWFGLSEPQRQTLMRAVEGGYYAIPRRLSTQDLADEFDVSDQAVTERLRRAISTLVENTLTESVEKK